MSAKRFDAITAALSFTDVNKPTYRDKFWEVCQMISEWNKNMAEAFSPGLILCLDMSFWHSHLTCPGWVFWPQKPYPFGNDYHTTCCGMSGLMFVIEMVEGKDQPIDLGAPEFEGIIGKTGGLLFWVMKSCLILEGMWC